MRPAIPDLEIHEHGTFDIEILVVRFGTKRLKTACKTSQNV